jgi:CheY-like chemotaxis protein
MSEPGSGAAPDGLCVLVVEDEMLVAMMLERVLRDLGYRVIKAARVARATQLAADAAIDAAILDVNLAGKPSYEVAETLRQRGIPFVIASGYDPGRLPAEFRDLAVLRKPYTPAQVERLLAEAIRPRNPPR